MLTVAQSHTPSRCHPFLQIPGRTPLSVAELGKLGIKACLSAIRSHTGGRNNPSFVFNFIQKQHRHIKKNRLSTLSHVLLSNMLLLSTLLLSTLTYAQQQTSLYSTSFRPCCSNCTQFTTFAFNVSLTPSNRTLNYQLSGDSTFAGQTELIATLFHDGDSIFYQNIDDPCSDGEIDAIPELCPIATGSLNISVTQEVPQRLLDFLPGDILTTPDPDVSMSLYLFDVRGNRAFGCVQANLTNGIAQMPSGNATATSSGSDGADMNSAGTSTTSGTGTPTSESSAGRPSFDWRSLL